MELFKNARYYFGRIFLKNKLDREKRKVSYTAFSYVKKIGIVWDASNRDEFTPLSRFCQKMNERNIDVKILGYFPDKNLPDQYTAIRYLTCIKRDELNYFYLPVSKESELFINNKFDILIDINHKKVFPLEYITALSVASLKVGIYNPSNEEFPFDLMIELKAPVIIDDYLSQTVHYLEMIKTGKPNSKQLF